MKVTSDNAVSMAKTNPDRALEIARMFPFKAHKIALAFNEERTELMAELAELSTGEGLLMIVQKYPNIIPDVAVNNLDMISQILKQVSGKEEQGIILGIASKLAEASKSNDQGFREEIIKALKKLFAENNQHASNIVRKIQDVDEELAREFSFPQTSNS